MVTHKVESSKPAHCLCRSIFIDLPKKTFLLAWDTQMFFIYLPFRCATKIIRVITSILKNKFENKEKRLLKTIMCCELDDNKKVLNAVCDMQTSLLSAVSKINFIGNRPMCFKNDEEVVGPETSLLENEEENDLCDSFHSENYKQIQSEDSENESRPDLAIKNYHAPLKSLPKILDNDANERLQKHIFHNFFLSYLDKLCNEKDCPTFNDQCPDVISSNNNSSYPLFAFDSMGEHQSDISLEVFKTFAKLLNSENCEVKEHLKMVNSQLDDVKATTSRLDQKVLGLETQLIEIKGFLEAVLEDRNTMRNKLIILREMIEEEEILLNDDNSNSYSDRYLIDSQSCSSRDTSTPLHPLEISFEESEE